MPSLDLDRWTLIQCEDMYDVAERTRAALLKEQDNFPLSQQDACKQAIEHLGTILAHIRSIEDLVEEASTSI